MKCGANHTMVMLEGYGGSSGNMVFGFGDNRFCQVNKARSAKHGQPKWLKSLLPVKGKTVNHIAAGYCQSAVYV